MDLSSTAGLDTLRTLGRLLGYLIFRPRELDVELLLVDGLPEGPHGALQLLLHLLAHAVHVAGVCAARESTKPSIGLRPSSHRWKASKTGNSPDVSSSFISISNSAVMWDTSLVGDLRPRLRFFEESHLRLTKVTWQSSVQGNWAPSKPRRTDGRTSGKRRSRKTNTPRRDA